LIKEYLCEILKAFLDNDCLVQESACAAFCSMLISSKEKIESFLFDVFKILTSAFQTYTGNTLLNLYDVFILLIENYPEKFRNENLSGEITNCVLSKFLYDINYYINSSLENNSTATDITPFFDVLISLIKATGMVVPANNPNLISGVLTILNMNYKNYLNKNKDVIGLDIDLIGKCFDMLSAIYNNTSEYMINNPQKNNILESVCKYIEINDCSLNNYCILLLADILREDKLINGECINFIIIKLIKFLELQELNSSYIFQNYISNEPNEAEKLSVCANTCRALGIIALSYPNTIREYLNHILQKLTKIISLPRVSLIKINNCS